MRAIHKRLLIAFIILVTSKVVLSFLIPSPTIFADEYYYSTMARSYFKDFSFQIFNYPSGAYPPLYPMILSLGYIFKDMRIIYTVFKIINALLSSLIILPVWLITKEFLNERKASLVAILSGLWPVGFILSFFVMAENLFFILLLFTIYLFYKSLIEKDLKWDFLAGIFLGLTYLTKVLGVALVFGTFISFVVYLMIKKDKSQIKRKILLYGMALLTVLPWLMRNGSIFGWNLSGIVGYADEFSTIASNFHITAMLYWVLSYFVYLILATGIIILVFNLLKPKSEKTKLFSIITWACVISFILIASLHSAKSSLVYGWLNGRPLGRYVAGVIPLMLILSFINLKSKNNFYKNKLKYILICTVAIIASFKLFNYNLFPINTTSLSYVGLVDLGIKYLLNDYSFIATTAIFALVPFYLLFIKYLNFKKLLYLIGFFFVMINFISFGMIYYNSNYRWEPLDQMQLGLWYNDNIDSTDENVLFDYRDDAVSNNLDRRMRRGAFWMNSYARVGNINNITGYDYLVSKHALPYTKLKEIGDFKLYEL